MYFFLSKILAPFISLSNFLFLILIVSYFLKKFFLKKIIRFVNYTSIFLLIIFSLFPIGKILINTLEARYIETEIPINYDYIVVLGGSEDAYASFVTNKVNLNSGSERLIASVKLANQKKESKIIYLGGSGLLKKNNLNETDVARFFYIDIGFDIERVIFVDNTRNTIENLHELKKLNLQNENNSILITSAFHMKRALLISEKLNLNLIPYAVDFRSLSDTGKDSLINYYQRLSFAKNLLDLDMFFREFLGIIAVKFFNVI